jgi:hypothetical protein
MSDAPENTPSNVRVDIAIDGQAAYNTSGTLATAAESTNAYLTGIVDREKTERAAKKAKS